MVWKKEEKGKILTIHFLIRKFNQNYVVFVPSIYVYRYKNE